MVSEEQSIQGLVLDGVMLCRWKLVPPGQESLFRKRLQAAIRTKKLLPRTNADNEVGLDTEQDAIMKRLDRLESAMERLLMAVRFGPRSDPELTRQWLCLGQEGMEIRLAPKDGVPSPVGSLVHVKWAFPHLPDYIQECLAVVTRVYDLDAGWKSMVMEYDFVDAETRDEIGRAAFLAQRLSRWSDR